MIKTIISWFKPPVYDTDAKNLIGKMLHIILLGATIIAGLVTILTIILQFGPQFLIINGSSFLIAIFLWLAARRGYVRGVSLLLSIALFLVAVLLTYMSGSVRNSVVSVYFMAVIAAGLLTSTTILIIITGASVMSIVILMQLEAAGMLPPSGLNLVSGPQEIIPLTSSLILSALFLWLAKRGIDHNLRNYRETAEKLSHSNAEMAMIRSSLEEVVTERTSRAETARQEALALNSALADQVWLSRGQTLLNEKMRGDQSIADLANNVLQQLCPYVNAQVGALFVLQHDTLVLVGRYAYPSDNGRSEFKLGQGLVGQTAVEKQAVWQKSVSGNYLKVISGLGQNESLNLAVIPFIYENDVKGVIELGGWEPFTAAQQKFLEQAMETIGIAFHTAQSRARIDELLTQTQQVNLLDFGTDKG